LLILSRYVCLANLMKLLTSVMHGDLILAFARLAYHEALLWLIYVHLCWW
jgi:hypothetical protein